MWPADAVAPLARPRLRVTGARGAPLIEAYAEPLTEL